MSNSKNIIYENAVAIIEKYKNLNSLEIKKIFE